MTGRPAPTHTVQLAAAVVTFLAASALVPVGAAGVDGPDRATWAPWFGGILVVWYMAFVWALVVIGLSFRAALREQRAARRPRLGSGGRPIPPLVPADRIDYATERPLRVAADEWAAEQARARHAYRTAA